MSRNLMLLGAVAVVLLSAGCASNEATAPQPLGRFEPDASPRAVDYFAFVQSSRGAVLDATLRDHHFDGVALNALGQDKLVLMTRAHEGSVPLTVYLASGDAAVSAARRDEVQAWFSSAGIAEGRYALVNGANAATVSPADWGVEDLNSLRGNADEQSSGPTNTLVGMSGGSQ